FGCGDFRRSRQASSYRHRRADRSGHVGKVDRRRAVQAQFVEQCGEILVDAVALIGGGSDVEAARPNQVGQLGPAPTSATVPKDVELLSRLTT
ncbi:MAG: hypothetical protein U5O16_36580, partial [Rhodococcus sp. (in: high G+C Gram-positive bacteria)]|uniref:hypothetical protein n=1 Tax=Rhodococcus sp. TaxID=1831 RepID=UPI002ADA10C3|nr:hypothetical protein [Rhodococcus sp. (in: high G+C Gram-positive bacteria)]